jgi:hypothetical protein
MEERVRSRLRTAYLELVSHGGNVSEGHTTESHSPSCLPPYCRRTGWVCSIERRIASPRKSQQALVEQLSAVGLLGYSTGSAACQVALRIIIPKRKDIKRLWPIRTYREHCGMPSGASSIREDIVSGLWTLCN